MSLQPDLNLAQQRKRAKDLRRAHQEGNMEAAVRIARHLPRARSLSPETILISPFTLSEAQLVVAREAGFPSWPNLKHHIEGPSGIDRNEALIDAALEGDTDAVDRDPSASTESIYVACALANVEAAFAILNDTPEVADHPGGRRMWRPLLYLCSSRYRRDENQIERTNIARRLIALGARVTGREPDFSGTHGAMMAQDNDLFAIEAAAGRAASAELVRVLLDAGADLEETTVALLQAVRGGIIEVLKLLLDVLPKEVSWQANWAIQESVVTGRKDMTRMLAEHVELPAEGAINQAIRLSRDRETIEILLGSKDLSGRRGQRIYRQAVRYGNSDAAQLLAARGADQSAVNDIDRVLGACVNGDGGTLRAFLDQNGSLHPYLRNVDHQLLPWAIRTNRHHAVPLLLEAGLDPNVPDTDGETPLHLAVRAGGVETVDQLIRSGASIDAGNFDAQTPLEVALGLTDPGARERVTRRLLDSGASPGRMSKFHPAASLSIEEKLRQGGAIEREDPDLLFERAADAVAFGDVEALREMLDEEPSLVHARSPRAHRATLLHYCGANGTEAPRQRTPPNAAAVMQLLLDRGANVDAMCNLYQGGATTIGLLLSSAFPVRAGLRTSLTEILLKAGAKLGASTLSRAAALGDLDLVRHTVELAERDQSSELKSRFLKEQVQSAFMWACDFGRTKVAEFLLEKGADLAVQNQDGQTGLHLAACSGHLDTVKMLLKRRPPLEVQNAWCGTVLGSVLWAAVNHDPNVDYAPIVEALIDAGAKVEPGSAAWWARQDVLCPASKQRIEDCLKSGARS